jgi:hypothetical protein
LSGFETLTMSRACATSSLTDLSRKSVVKVMACALFLKTRIPKPLLMDCWSFSMLPVRTVVLKFELVTTNTSQASTPCFLKAATSSEARFL